MAGRGDALRRCWVNGRLRRALAAYLLFNINEWASWIALLVWAYAAHGVRGASLIAVVMLVPAALLASVAATWLGALPTPKALRLGYLAQAVTTTAAGVVVCWTRRSRSWPCSVPRARWPSRSPGRCTTPCCPRSPTPRASSPPATRGPARSRRPRPSSARSSADRSRCGGTRAGCSWPWESVPCCRRSARSGSAPALPAWPSPRASRRRRRCARCSATRPPGC